MKTMSQQQLKNIYETLGSMRFKYHGMMMYVLQDEATGECELHPV